MAPIASRYDMDKFDGSNDFGLWRIKMEAFLCSQGLEGALEPEAIGTSTENETPALIAAHKETQVEIKKKAYSLLILSLGDKVLREVSKLKSAVEIWKRLEDLYLKRLSSQLFLKAGFF